MFLRFSNEELEDWETELSRQCGDTLNKDAQIALVRECLSLREQVAILQQKKNHNQEK